MLMKVYRLIKPDDYKGLFKVSIVDDPAIKSNLMAFDSEKPEYTFAVDEKRIIYAPALIPNKLIFRKNINGEPANVYFDAETIADLQIGYFRQNGNKSTNVNHQQFDTEGVFSFENWIIEDKVHDKSVKMGFDLPIGTMMMGYKIENDQVWDDVKNGNLTGLSVEVQLFPEEVKEQVNFKKEDMNKKGLLAKALEFFKEQFNFADMTDYGNGFFGSSLEIGAIVTDKEGNPMPNAEFEYDGNKYKTDDMGAISEVEPIEAKEMEDDKGGNAELDSANAKITELETKIADLEAQLTEATATKMANEEAEVKLKADYETALKNVEKLEAEIIELKAIPAIPAEKEVPYEQMTNAQKAKYNRGKM